MIHDNQQPEMKGALSLEGGEARWIKALWDSGAKGGYIKSESPVLKDHTLNAYSKTRTVRMLDGKDSSPSSLIIICDQGSSLCFSVHPTYLLVFSFGLRSGCLSLLALPLHLFVLSERLSINTHYLCHSIEWRSSTLWLVLSFELRSSSRFLTLCLNSKQQDELCNSELWVLFALLPCSRSHPSTRGTA